MERGKGQSLTLSLSLLQTGSWTSGRRQLRRWSGNAIGEQEEVDIDGDLGHKEEQAKDPPSYIT